MFFKRAAKTAAPKPALGSVQTIPEIFYGGSDPEAGLRGAAASKSVKPNSVTSIGGAGSSSSSSGHTKLIAFVMIIIFLIVSAGAAWGYWKYLGGGVGPAATETTSKEMPQSNDPAPVQITPVETVTSTVTSTEVLTTTSTSNFTTTSTAFVLSELSPDFPAINQLNAIDADSDTLTDLEEEIFDTDSSLFDSDSDGYSDGQEVLNLYNPKGISPVRLAESGLVREFTHPRDVYRLYYPISWQAGSVDAGSNTMLFTAGNGDYVEVRIFTKNNTEDFSGWFGRVAKDEQITDLQTVSNAFKTSYYMRKDNLVLYVDMPGQVVVILYHPLVNAPINYRTTLKMMIESLRIPGQVNTSSAL
ncbi:MAG: hypothetical protein KAZ30_00365 [Candidatus Magasanikbacteria bacterium]|nr:hypothetical protein [Candidatus Magasanikbacteria bacterium]